MLNTRVRKTVQVICVMGALLAGVSHAQAHRGIQSGGLLPRLRPDGVRRRWQCGTRRP